MRLAVYLELPYRHDPDGYSTDRAFIQFVLAVGSHFGGLRLIGRLVPEPGRAAYSIPPEVEFHPLPHYPTLRDLPRFLRAVPATLPVLWRSLDDVDAVWDLGPHPMSLPIALFALARRRRLVLGVRQDFPQYVRHRLPSGRWRGVVGVAHALDAAFRLLAHRVPTIAVGTDLARKYSGGSAPVLDLAVSLVAESAVAAGPRDPSPPGGRPLELLAVGRLDSEKAPEVLVRVLERLRREDGRDWRLTFVGTGPLEDELRALAEPLGEAVTFRGYVTHGPELLELYREADVFVHSARTEGLPQVLVEAQAAALPIVAADVGGVRAALGDGARGLVVPSGDTDAYVAAILRLVDDRELARKLTAAGLAHARELTLERQAANAARFIAQGAG